MKIETLIAFPNSGSDGAALIHHRVYGSRCVSFHGGPHSRTCTAWIIDVFGDAEAIEVLLVYVVTRSKGCFG